jgi:ketosteroid isomerase-like protein
MKVKYGISPQRKAIKDVFEAFLEALKRNDRKGILALLAKDVTADISMTGQVQGAKDVSEAFDWVDKDYTKKKFTVTNFVCRMKDGIAQQSAYIQVLLANIERGYLFPFEFGGEFLLSYRLENEVWKISSIKFDMQWEKGNTYFKKDWNFLDYVLHKGGNNTIVSEFDAPWRVIPDTEELGSEEEQIVDAFARYAWGLDNTDFDICRSCMTDDIYAIMPHSNYSGVRNLIAFFKNVNHKEAAVQHAARVVDIRYSDNKTKAQVVMYRIEPHRLGTKTLTKENIDYNVYSARYDCDMVKENGLWKFVKIDYKGKVFFEFSESNNMFVDEV